MFRRSILAALVAGVASFGATLSAVALYLFLILHQPSSDLLATSLFIGASYAALGFVFAAVLGATLRPIKGRVSPPVFGAISVIAAVAEATVLGVLQFGRSPHVSTPIAVSLLASTWAVVAALVSLVPVRTP